MSNKYTLGFAFYEDRVILIIRSRPEWQKGLLNGIGGKVEKDETPKEAIHRECKEELGLSLEWFEYATVYGDDYTLFVFGSELTTKELIQLPECTDIGDIILMLDTNSVKQSECVDHVKVLVELGKARKHFTHIKFDFRYEKGKEGVI